MSVREPVPAAAPPSEKPVIERRATVRYACFRQCLVRPESATGIGNWPGITSNISATGICLAIPMSVAIGTVLVIEPWGPRNYGSFRARVVRSWMESFVWFHGCEFLQRLTPEELRSWLAGVETEPLPDGEA
jgi:PilZ domain